MAPNNVGRASEWTAGPRQGAPEGWHNVVSTEVGSGPRGHLFYGYAASNKCCKDWLLLGWPSTPDGRPVHRGATADPVLGLTCPTEGRELTQALDPAIFVDRRDERTKRVKPGRMSDK